jgi:hypothetical protein
MAEIEGAVGRIEHGFNSPPDLAFQFIYSSMIGRQFQSLPIVFLCAVNTKFTFWTQVLAPDIYIELSGVKFATHETPE